MSGIPLSVVILLIVFVAVALRQFLRLKLGIWQIMLVGAVAVLITGQIGPIEALSYIDYTVIVFLVAIFIVGEALTESGYIQNLSSRIFRSAKSVDILMLSIIFFMGFASMFLLNDTLAVIGLPVVMLFASREHIDPKLMIFALAFSITIGSIASPIGNPQNILIASSSIIKTPFSSFFGFLLIPTIASLISVYLILRLYYRKEFNRRPLHHEHPHIKDKELALLSKASLAILGLSIIFELISPLFRIHEPNIAYIAIAAALPILLFSKKRFFIIKHIQWSTIVFFIALFVLVGSVWISGFIQHGVAYLGLNLLSVPTVIISSIIGSQFISNVPMVLIYLKFIEYSGVPVITAMALAAGSTVAGNLTILGAASNVIIVQGAEKNYKIGISFMEFLKVGLLVTIVNFGIYWFFLAVLHI